VAIAWKQGISSPAEMPESMALKSTTSLADMDLRGKWWKLGLAARDEAASKSASRWARWNMK